jgi:hypothetical protein
MRTRVLVALASLAAAGATIGVAFAQGGRPSAVEAQPLPGLPRYTAGFQRWPKMNFKALPARGGNAHPGRKLVYVNKSRRVLAPGGKQRFPYRYGTIIVKTASSGGFVHLVAIGRKRRGFDRRNGDWEFVEYTRDRAQDRFGLTASGQVCYSCHVGARRTDWIFTRGFK